MSFFSGHGLAIAALYLIPSECDFIISSRLGGGNCPDLLSLASGMSGPLPDQPELVLAASSRLS